MGGLKEEGGSVAGFKGLEKIENGIRIKYFLII